MVLALAIGSVVAGIAVLLRTPWQPWGDDFAGYLLQAHAMAAGKMGAEVLLNGSLVAATSYLAPAAYPWGFPALLWMASWIGDWGLMPLKVIGALSLGTVAAFTFALSRSFLSRSASVFAATLVGLQPELLQSTDLLLSDLPFLALAALALHQMDRSYRAAADGRRSGVMVAAIFTVAAFTTRGNGITVAATFILMHGYLWTVIPGRRTSIARSGALYGLVVVVLVALYVAWSPGDPSNAYYVTLVSVTPRSVLGMVGQIGLQVSSFLPFTSLLSISPTLTMVGTAACAGLVVLGAAARRPFGYGLVLFGLLNLGLLVVFPFVQGPRYLYPLLIPGVILAVCGGQSVWESAHNPLTRSTVVKRRLETAGPWLVGGLAVLMVVRGYGVRNEPKGYQLDGPYSAESQELTHFIVEKLPPDARIAFFRPRALRLLTGRPALAIRTSEQAARVDYVVLNKWRRIGWGPEYLVEHQTEFERMFENRQFVLYHRLTVHP